MKTFNAKLLLLTLLVLAAANAITAHAIGRDAQAPIEAERYDNLVDGVEDADWVEDPANQFEDASGLKSVLIPLRHAQSNQKSYRSRSDIMREVKKRYNAKVLKISLNEQREVYNVRVLMPNGKVRNLQISAKR